VRSPRDDNVFVMEEEGFIARRARDGTAVLTAKTSFGMTWFFGRGIFGGAQARMPAPRVATLPRWGAAVLRPYRDGKTRDPPSHTEGGAPAQTEAYAAWLFEVEEDVDGVGGGVGLEPVANGVIVNG
jgi:hypothetical protein